jgi:hypothetical protein
MKNNAGFQTIALTRIHESNTNPRRNDQPSRPNAMTCSRFSLLKTWLMTTVTPDHWHAPREPL